MADILGAGRNFVVAIAAEGQCLVYDVRGRGDMRLCVAMALPHNVSAAHVGPLGADDRARLAVATEDDSVLVFDLTAVRPDTGTGAEAPPVVVEARSVLEQKLLLENCQVESVSCVRSADRARAAVLGVMCEAPPDTAHFYVHYGHTFCCQSLPAQESTSSSSPTATTTTEGATATREERIHGKTLASVQIEHETLPSGLFAVVSHHGDVGLYRLLPLLSHLDPAATAEDRALPVTEQVWVQRIRDLPVLSLSLVALHGAARPPVVVVCCWNGVTHLFDVDGHHAKFSFVHNVQAFAAGAFALAPGARASTCFAYATFHHRIVLYHDVECMCLPALSFLDTLAADPDVPALLAALVAPNAHDRAAEAHSIVRAVLQQTLLPAADCRLYAAALQSRIDALTAAAASAASAASRAAATGAHDNEQHSSGSPAATATTTTTPSPVAQE